MAKAMTLTRAVKREDTNLNGTRTWTRKTGTGGVAIFIELPRALWRSCGPCQCSHCKGAEGFWDTLVVSESNGHGYTVHCPERR